MKKKVIAALGWAMFAALAVLIWQLDIPHWKPLDLSRLTDMPGTTLVYDSSGAAVGALQGGEKRTRIGLDQVPEVVQNAFIAAEDLRFYRHHGVDTYRLLGALWHDIRTLSYSQGGSTITQQLIKLTHLTQTKTLSRKVQEMFLALKLERVMDKRQILEAYLNAVYFGHGAYGIEAAANVYFGKPASELTLAEGALLAGVIKAPSVYAPHLNGEKAVSRRNSILNTMAENGFITEDERDEARSEPLRLAEDSGDTQYAWYLDTVLDEASRVLNVSADEAISGGYRIHTALDTAMQAAAESLFENDSAFPESADDGTPTQAALVALDAETGGLRAIVGGRSYDVRRGLNRATQMRRQPGSAFKPVSTYAAAVDAYGYVPASIVDDTPRTFEGGYAPRNAGGNSYGLVTLREALSRSLNIATVALADSIGTPALRTYAQRFGLELAPQDANLSLALGALTYGVSPAELGAAYCALANGGERVSPHAILSIEDSDGHEIYRAPGSSARAVGEDTAYLITDMLKTAASTGSARALAEAGMPVAGKTGTVGESDGGTRDVWTVAYTPQVSVAVWMGFDEPGSGHSLPASEGGSGYPARLCAAWLKAVSPELSGGDFSRPAGVGAALVDALSLKREHAVALSTGRTPPDYTLVELFHADAMPQAFSDCWDAPAPVSDLRLLTGPGETPVLAFTVPESTAEYVLTRTVDGASSEIAVLSGEPGQEVRFADTEHDLSHPAEYALLPRNAILAARGELLAGPSAGPARYVPGGLLNMIMGVGTAEATPTPSQIESPSDQSLFS
ncbi:MAG: PBP1A family penicillin-binding protein [Clostridia bacterium]|nr:PBP1A family penicillin-binding protein [Clostridia bacterium]